MFALHVTTEIYSKILLKNPTKTPLYNLKEIHPDTTSWSLQKVTSRLTVKKCLEKLLKEEGKQNIENEN